MPISKDRFEEDFKYAKQVHLTGADREVLYWLVQESSIDDDVKERLSNKVQGFFVSPKTELLSRKLLERRRMGRKK